MQTFLYKLGNAGLSDEVAKNPEHKSQLVRPRRSVVSKTVTPGCENFFLDKAPPIGFRLDHTNIRYICQQLPGDVENFYSTMFDLDYGIPIYSAYLVTKEHADEFGTATRAGITMWREETGIKLQGSDSKYAGQTTHAKGHLLPAETYSFTDDHMLSTFTYTNAVPQTRTFNSGAWAQSEKNIRNYATYTCSKKGGDLYLITGVSEAQIKEIDTTSTRPVVQAVKLKSFRGEGGIKIPNSMWTAGCCVVPDVPKKGAYEVKGAFAVIGNNVKALDRMHMSSVTVKELQDILHVGVHGAGGTSGIVLFPGNPECSSDLKQVKITGKPPYFV
ncbi:endonuclease domain-containing 1 protein-like [Oculina patagonica]